jgi:uridine kinase
LRRLTARERVDVPKYDFKTHSRSKETTLVYGANVIIFEGLFTLYDERVRNMLDLKVFVDTDSDIRLARRIKRDIGERGRDLQAVLDQYARFVKPSYENYIHPSKRFADIILPRGLDNKVCIWLTQDCNWINN